MTLTAGTRLGAYEITGVIGAGGMGEVYRARDTKLNRDVAIKILPELFAADSDRVARFEREAQTLASLNHPNIAQIYGIVELPAKAGSHTSALVMECVDGEDLAQRLARGAVPIDEALPIARQIADALEAAHERGIVHRDLKPANIKISPDGAVKVLDFGLAKAMDDAGRSLSSGGPEGPPHGTIANSPTFTSPAMMTQMGVILGTAAYMAPEQARGKPVDRRADVWAFGVVIYEMLSGRPCFPGAEMQDVLAAVLRQPIDWTALPPDTPASVRRLLRRCLERERSERLGDMSAARLDIKDARAADEAAEKPAWRERRRWMGAAVGLAAVAIVLAAALAIALIRAPGAPSADAPVVRFALLDDPRLRVNVMSTSPFAVSRDGTTVVFSADAGAGLRLWARTLDQRDPRPLAGTVGGYQPAISPDGQWIAFVAANHIIRKVPISGGGVTTLASIDDVTAALAWVSNDQILFEKIGSGSGIHQVSANGGSPELLIPIDEAAGERLQRRPFVLRDERVVIYASSTADGTALAAFSLTDHRRARLGLDGTQAVGIIQQHLVYSRRDGSLMAVPFDARAMRVTGTPRQLADRVLATPFGTSVAFSDGGTLVSAPAVSPSSRLMIGDAAGKTVQVGDAVRAYDSPRFSPDGRRIGVTIADGDARDVWVLDAASGAATRVTRGGQGAIELQEWTPDGTALVYVRQDQLWIAQVGGSAEPRRLVAIDGRVTGASFMPDGRSVIVARRVPSLQNAVDREELVLVPLAGDGAVVPILTSRSSGGTMRPAEPRVSPDGKWVAFQDRNERQIHVRSLDGSASVQVSDTSGDQPLWASDSRRLFYQSSEGLVAADLQIAPLEVLRRVRFPQFPASDIVSGVSAGGKAFLLVAPVDSGPNVFVTVNWPAALRRQLRTGDVAR
jgi:Tol biopolymer transport system component